MIIFNFPIDPVAKGRPRFGRGRTYTPKKTKDFENTIKEMARKQYRNGPMSGALSMHVVFYIKKPKSSKLRYPTGKRPGDLDNMAKALGDALNSIAYIDDSQIIDLSCHKRYSDQARIIVTIGDVLDELSQESFGRTIN